MSDSSFGLTSIGQVHLPARDLDRAVRFYRETLGVPFLFQVPRMAFFDLDGVRLMLGERENGNEASGSILYYRVDDIDAAHETLGGRGVRFDQEPTLIAEMEDHDLWMAFFHDTEGNQLALMAEVPKP
jgi:predicted enzyme related to lactoylglutathione lyase